MNHDCFLIPILPAKSQLEYRSDLLTSSPFAELDIILLSRRCGISWQYTIFMTRAGPQPDSPNFGIAKDTHCLRRFTGCLAAGKIRAPRPASPASHAEQLVLM